MDLSPYVALALGLVASGVFSPVPEEVALIGAGAATHSSMLQFVPTALAAMVGVVLGDLAFIVAGRAAAKGTRLLRINPSRRWEERAQKLLARWEFGAVLIARFVPGLRGAIFFAAGAMGKRPQRVLAIDMIAAMVHVPLLVALGATATAQ